MALRPTYGAKTAVATSTLPEENKWTESNINETRSILLGHADDIELNAENITVSANGIRPFVLLSDANTYYTSNPPVSDALFRVTDDGVNSGDYTRFSATNTNSVVRPFIEKTDDLSDTTGKVIEAESVQIALNNKADVSEVTEINTKLDSIYVSDENIAGTLVSGFISKADGTLTANGGWQSSGFLPVFKGSSIRRVGNEVLSASSASGFSFYDSSQTYLGFYENIPSEVEFNPFDFFANTAFIRASSSTGAPLELYFKSNFLVQIDNNTLTGKITSENFDYATQVTNGFLTADGSFTESANWRGTDFIEVYEGQIVKYEGETTGGARAVVAYNADKSFNSVLEGVVNYTSLVDVIIPTGVSFVRASAKMVAPDTFVFLVDRPKSQLIEKPFFLAKEVYAKQGEAFAMNTNGVIAKHPNDYSVDVFWDSQLSQEDTFRVTPNTTNIETSLKRRLGNYLETLATTTIKVTANADITSPATAQNFICLGDSLTDGNVNSGIQGAYVNELSRRLTGTGFELLTGLESPTALALNNIYFRGTLGDQVVKHEGRGGWSADTYTNLASSSGLTNAFWNPLTLEFDLDYYLSENNFNDGQTLGGVDATGSNLTMIIFLVWNDVYNENLEASIVDLKVLIDKIKADKSGVKVKLLGAQPPAPSNYKTYSGQRNVSVESIMREAVVNYNEAYYNLSQEGTYAGFVEFVQISHNFFPENSYPSINIQRGLRDDTQQAVYTDHVHPNKRGYAQIADAVFYNILYNYCR